MTSADARHHDDPIARALGVEGGHLAIGLAGYMLHTGRGSTLSGYDCDEMKRACIAAGLPVIDSRSVAFETVWRIAVKGPMVAVGDPPSLEPYHALSYAPLVRVARAYRDAGAEVFNLDLPQES
jgi:hypothetical protein